MPIFDLNKWPYCSSKLKNIGFVGSSSGSDSGSRNIFIIININ